MAVLGCSGSVGASTVALAIAEAIDGGGGWAAVRVLECCPAARSGLVSASTAELGPVGPVGAGWARGRRGDTVIDRLISHPPHAAAVPVPAEIGPGPAVTVVDLGWDVDDLLGVDSGGEQAGRGGWLTAPVLTAARLVVVAVATVPGMRHLERALSALTRVRVPAGLCQPSGLSGPSGASGLPAPQTIAVVRGPSRWPRPVRAAAGPATVALAETGSVATVPSDRSLVVHGLDSTALPRPIRRAADAVVDHLDLPTPDARAEVFPPAPAPPAAPDAPVDAPVDAPTAVPVGVPAGVVSPGPDAAASSSVPEIAWEGLLS